MRISSFDDFLTQARLQSDPQRLLFVFTKTERPDDATPAQLAAYQEGTGGALTPMASLDKALDEVESFTALSDEALQHVPDWKIVFVAALAGRDGTVLTQKDAEKALDRMIEMIKMGSVASLIPFDTSGHAVLLNT